MKRIEQLIQELKMSNEPTLLRQTRSNLALRSFEKQIAQIQPCKRILDLGCGAGLATAMLQDRFPKADISAIDIQWWDSWKTIKKHYPKLKFGQYCGEHIYFGDSTLDAVVAFGVLEHVTEGGISEDSFLQEIRRVLKDKGKLYIFNLPNKLSWKENLAKVLGFNHHKRRFSKLEAVGLLNKNGFVVDSMKLTGFLPYGCGKGLAFSPILNTLAFIEDKIPENRWMQCHDLLCEKF